MSDEKKYSEIPLTATQARIAKVGTMFRDDDAWMRITRISAPYRTADGKRAFDAWAIPAENSDDRS